MGVAYVQYDGRRKVKHEAAKVPCSDWKDSTFILALLLLLSA
jgi:hypothetical protein